MTTSVSLPCRVIVDPPADGPLQMAVDEVLLESAAERGLCSLRFYGWSQPMLSLGYFQSHADRARHAASFDCPLVRRHTGGGAILHDREVTYSLAMPLAHPLADEPARLYRGVHLALVEVLAGLGVTLSLRPDVDKVPPAEEPFLCFQRRTEGDIVAGQVKLGGSAQRRRRGAVLQHGSLLLAASAFAPELPGVAEVFGISPSVTQFVAAAQTAIAHHLGLALNQEVVSADERAAAVALADEKYRNPLWNQRR